MKMIEKKRWVFFALPFTFTKYTVTDEELLINNGFFTKRENSCYMYKIVDIELTESIFERIFKLGTIVCYTGDVTHEKLYLNHIRNAKVIRDAIFKNSETHRLKRKVVNIESIDTSDIDA